MGYESQGHAAISELHVENANLNAAGKPLNHTQFQLKPQSRSMQRPKTSVSIS
jgi:hypothetical protein